VSYSQLFSYYYLFSFRVLIVMERSDSHIFHTSRFRPTHSCCHRILLTSLIKPILFPFKEESPVSPHQGVPDMSSLISLYLWSITRCAQSELKNLHGVRCQFILWSARQTSWPCPIISDIVIESSVSIAPPLTICRMA
jgi:hypothetical protein